MTIFFFQAEDGIRDLTVTGVQTCALPICWRRGVVGNIYKGKVQRVMPGMQAAFVEVGLERAAFLHANDVVRPAPVASADTRSEEHTSELQSQSNLVCRLLLEKKKI